MLTKELVLQRQRALQDDMNAIAGALQTLDWVLEQMEEEAPVTDDAPEVLP